MYCTLPGIFLHKVFNIWSIKLYQNQQQKYLKCIHIYICDFPSYMHAIEKVKNGTYVEIQNDFRKMLNFYDSLYGLWVKEK